MLTLSLRLMLLTLVVTFVALPADAQTTTEDATTEDTTTEAADSADTDFTLPDGATEQEAQEFLRTIQRKPAPSNRPADLIDHYGKFGDAVEQVLSRDYSPELLEAAASMRFRTLNMLEQLGDDKAAEKRVKWVQSLQQSESDLLKRFGNGFGALNRVIDVATTAGATEEQWRTAVKPTVDMLENAQQDNGEIGMFEVQIAMVVAETLEQAAPNSVAGPTYQSFATTLGASNDPQLQQVAEMFNSTGRRISLPGSPIIIKGTTLDGQPFDIQKDFEGKVVLVDFWATWCGFCIEAFPSLKDTYAAHNEEGFEIVGVNLDDTREIVDEYLDKNPLPWTNIQVLGDATTEKHANANRYDVRGIPFLVLVGRDGKVISTKVTPENLESLVTKALKEKP